jgi:hypothetical protein
MRRLNSRWLSMLMIPAGAALLQLGGCSPKGIGSYLSNFNPCGTILNCDPVAYRFYTSGYEGPGVDWDVDPVCTFPPFCANDPFAPAVLP